MQRIKFFVLGILLLAVIGAIFLWRFRSNQRQVLIDTNRTAVITQFRELGRLETTSFTIEKVIEAETDGNIFEQLLRGDQILFIAHGEVIAGVDLTKLTEDQIEVSEDEVTITLPSPEIFVVRLDNEQSRVYDRTRGLLSRGNDQLETQVRQAAESSIREAACEGNILNQANESAQKQLSALLKSLGFETVEINTIPTQC